LVRKGGLLEKKKPGGLLNVKDFKPARPEEKTTALPNYKRGRSSKMNRNPNEPKPPRKERLRPGKLRSSIKVPGVGRTGAVGVQVRERVVLGGIEQETKENTEGKVQPSNAGSDYLKEEIETMDEVRSNPVIFNSW